ncbi:MAG TPA: hypothetical protein VN372_07075 [Methanospirillum sp.]|nr:hypothetical protein [Methanospirillum sp.]
MTANKAFLQYTSKSGDMHIDVQLRDETLWVMQKTIAELFGVQVLAITKHLKHFFESGEWEENSVISILETTASDSRKKDPRYYNHNAFIAVGYRVK